jgi:hypothetical protein
MSRPRARRSDQVGVGVTVQLGPAPEAESCPSGGDEAFSKPFLNAAFRNHETATAFEMHAECGSSLGRAIHWPRA